MSQSAERSAGDAKPRFARLRAVPTSILSGDTMTGNAFGMVAGRVSAMGLGFVFWLLAAHVGSQSHVGFAAAVISAMMLCTQFAQLGLGSAVITLLPTRVRPSGALLDVTLTMTAVGSAVVGVGFLVIAKAWLPELGQVATVPAWTAAFIALCVFGTLGVVLDQVNVGLQRGVLVIHRTVAFGIITLVPVLVVLVAGGGMSAFELHAVLGRGRRGCDLRRIAPAPWKCAAAHCGGTRCRCGQPSQRISLSASPRTESEREARGGWTRQPPPDTV